MTKHVSSVFFAAALLVLMAGIPVSAAVVQNGTVCEQAATLFIGEEGLNVTHALNQANGSADPNGEPGLTTIGWWASVADVSTTAPSRTINISTRYKNLTVEPSDFVGYTGTWYLLAANGHVANMDAIVFTVQDPSLDIRIWDYDRATDVNGETIPLGTRLVFRIDTNLYGAADDTYRSPLNPATDGFINITVKNDTGFEFPALYNDSTSVGPVAGPYSLLRNYVDNQPYYWGSPDTYSWKTGALDGGTNLYPAGTYTVSAESALNRMRDNYRQGGGDYTGKTVSSAYTVTLAGGILPAPVADFTADITSGESPLTVSFTDTSAGTRTGWTWTFGDGDPTNATEQDPVHTYAAAGTYDVSLVVNNATYGSDSTQKVAYITVTEPSPAPTTSFSANVTSGPAPLTVSFTDSSSGSPTGWAWFFGDETYSQDWTLVCATAPWGDRFGHSSVVMPDGSIILTGGSIGHVMSDVWRSMDNGATWTLVNASAWTGRQGHTSVVMPDGSIILVAGASDFSVWSDVWRSTDYGNTWTQPNASLYFWDARYGHTSVATPRGSIVVMGGYSGPILNDTWLSSDNGTTWTEVNEQAPWTARMRHSSVAMPDGSIILMGGDSLSTLEYKNDTWRSTDNSTTWTQLTPSAEWLARGYQSSVVMPDGSIILTGGMAPSIGYMNDTWRSTDAGATWTLVNARAGWFARYAHSSVVMPDGSIILTGGSNVEAGGAGSSEVWRFQPFGSSAQNPVHTYTKPGTYAVTLQAYNDGGYNRTQEVTYITVTGSSPDETIIGQGDTVFIGEEGLNVTHALNGAYYGGFCGADVGADDLNGIPPLTTIGWWPSPATISTTAPSRTIWLGYESQYKNLTADPSSFTGYAGNWYLLGANGRVYSPGMDGCGCTAAGCIASLVFRVQDLSAPLPQARVTITRDVLIEGFNNSLPGGIYNATVMNFLVLGHPSDGSGLSFGNLKYSIRTHNLTWVESDEYSVWNETSATWNFPAWYLLAEDSSQGVSDATAITVPHLMNVSLNRRFNQTRFDTPGYQYVSGNFSYASTEEILSTSLNIDMPFPDERVNAMMVPGSFFTDAPVLSLSDFDTGTGTIAWLDPSALEQGQIYNFSAVYRIEPNGIALLFKPMVTVDVMVSQVFLNSSVPGYGLEIPPAMVPEDVTAASVSTDTLIGDWSLAQEHRVVTRLNPKVEPLVTADFTADATSGPAPLTVTFMDTSTGSPTEWNWSFGDDSLVNATEQNPVHTYTLPGSYDVSLLAANTIGSNSTLKAGYITVTPSGGMAMVGVYRPTIQKFILKNGTEKTVVQWGLGTDTPVAGDWNGDGMGDVGVFRSSIAKFILKNGTEKTVVQWGLGTDTPVSGDWNGDGMGDVGVFRPSIAKFILKNGTEKTIVPWGLGTDTPVTGDWNGDGKGDVGVYRPSIQKFILKNGTERTVVAWGLATDIPVAGDWNGDGLTDVGVYRPTNQMFILKNGTEKTVTPWGLATDKPVTGKWS